MLGYYVHHHGSGHLHRALALGAAFDGELTGLSTLPRPHGWAGPWIQLPDDATPGPTRDNSANGRLHYVPLHAGGLAARMATISGWLGGARPDAVIVDVSVEIAALVRLHGIPVLVMAQPGVRTDQAHRLGYDLATTIISPWPRHVGGIWAATDSDLAKTVFVGPICRFPMITSASPPARRCVVVLNGTGGDGASGADIDAARSSTPGWDWIHLDRHHGTWEQNPLPLLAGASLVVSHAGQNAIAEIAAVRRPALVIPQDRPFDEQRCMAAALVRADLPVEIVDAWPAPTRWPDLLARVASFDPQGWRRWNDGTGPARAAAVLDEFDTSRTLATEAG